ncbi:UNKNOWN [Stylonychia lemnae]|uniref:Uncharacterized protein n=1 Tax=Stylonychia lemnae TaxID=5949 RepID=A0A078B446_STYLE|nr:UNKNOWN [Stylonychia lemnae]|eukprot:CDW89254.1 UNKNOWN [Stylonychia lemnae]
MILRSLTKRLGLMTPLQQRVQFSTNQDNKDGQEPKNIFLNKSKNHQNNKIFEKKVPIPQSNQVQEQQNQQRTEGNSQTQASGEQKPQNQGQQQVKKDKPWIKQQHEKRPQPQQPREQHQSQQKDQQQQSRSEATNLFQQKAQQHQQQQQQQQQRQHSQQQTQSTGQQQAYKEDVIGENEYVEDQGRVFIQTKVADVRLSRQRKVSSRKTVEDILEGEIIQEISVDTQSSINQNYQNFSQKFGINVQQDQSQQQKSSTAAEGLGKLDLSAQIQNILGGEGLQLSVIERRQDQINNQQANYVNEVEQALKDYEFLLEKTGSDHDILKSINKEKIESSPQIRSLLKDYQTMIRLIYRDPKTLDKPQKYIHPNSLFDTNKSDLQQQYENSIYSKQHKKIEEVQKKNITLMREVKHGEEGIDYKYEPAENDPTVPNEKMLLRQLKQQLVELKQTNPLEAREFEDFVLAKNEIDDLMTKDFDLSEVKFYPGSIKGPRPEDDPRAYTKWFVENQPKKAFEGVALGQNFSEFGVSSKIGLTGKHSKLDEKATIIEVLNPVNVMKEDMDLYPSFSLAPEFAMNEREAYTNDLDEELPTLMITSNFSPSELSPIPAEHSLRYQEVHHQYEQWGVFRSLPHLMKFDNLLGKTFQGLADGTLFVPNYQQLINPPSLWAYYQTLPRWARDHPGVRNVMMAYEYTKPNMDIRNKEIAMNYAVSFIRPIDKQLEDVIIDIALSNKLRLNVQRGKEAINSLRFYELDEELLGTTSEDEEGEEEIIGEDGQVIQQHEQRGFSSGIDDDEDAEKKVKSAMERFALGQEEDERSRELTKLLSEGVNIQQATQDSEANSVQSDFYIKPYQEDIYHKEEQDDPILPLHYYDNDDGFWSGYIQYKQKRMEKNIMITNRPFIKV